MPHVKRYGPAAWYRRERQRKLSKCYWLSCKPYILRLCMPIVRFFVCLWHVHTHVALPGRLASDALAGGSRPLGQAEEGSPPLFLFEGGHLCAAMHGAGINLRYLPMVRLGLEVGENESVTVDNETGSRSGSGRGDERREIEVQEG